jgi:exopolyphosphatase/guanosine-5'-triphosphate,3'-diphosphate pyrophosphatase
LTADLLGRIRVMRVGIIDVGSNTVRLLVATCAGNRLVPLLERRQFLGLGEEVENYGWISEVKLRETAWCVREQAAEARAQAAHHVEVVVTAPGRQSANAGELVAALAAAARASVRVLGAEEEGRLAYFGVLAGLDAVPESLAVCDLGGGSTELVVGTPAGPAWERSIDLGAVRLMHRLELDDPPGSDVLPAARREAHEMINGIAPPLPKAAYVTGGTARALRKVAGRKLGAKQLERAEALLCRRSSDEIAERFEIDPRRARTLLAGCLILAEVQARLAIPLEVAKTGLREGAALEALSELAAA